MPARCATAIFQEGYLAGTADVTTDFDSKTELDFRNRMIAKFTIPRAKAFWGTGFDQIPESALYLKGDDIRELCENLHSDVQEDLQSDDLGEFIRDWAVIEDSLLNDARRVTTRNVSIREAIGNFTKRGVLTPEQAAQLEGLRKFRNMLVHQPKAVSSASVQDWLETAREFRRILTQHGGKSPIAPYLKSI